MRILITTSPDGRQIPAYPRHLASLGAEGVMGVLPYDQSFDGLLLSGGGDVSPSCYNEAPSTDTLSVDPARDEYEFSVLRDFLAAGKPVYGICRGMQLLNVFFGGTLYQDIAGHSQVEGVDRYHEVVFSSHSPLSKLVAGETVKVNSSHHQAVRLLGSALSPAALSDDGYVEAFSHDRLPVLAVQWHPERYACTDRITKEFLRLCAARQNAL